MDWPSGALVGERAAADCDVKGSGLDISTTVNACWRAIVEDANVLLYNPVLDL